jgi:hypothetical protein
VLGLRVIRVEIAITTSAGSRSEVYQLVTTLLDRDPVTGYPAAEITKLYHERWEIETARVLVSHCSPPYRYC